MDYRQRALKILPWVCTRCAREFTGKNLRQLTVHHKDHDHTNNPPDGSNWELLCIYCHDDEHSRNETAAAYGKPATGRRAERGSFKAFEGLEQMLGGAAPTDAEEDGAATRDDIDAEAPDEAATRDNIDGEAADEAAKRGEIDGGAPDEAAGEEGSSAAEQPADGDTPASRSFWGDES